MNSNKLNLDFAQAVLEEYRETLVQFSELLIEENQKYNLTRIDSPEQIGVRHFLDSLAGLSVLDELSKKTGKPLRILDIGSGAGFPGLVLAIVRPQWQITSLEATEKKVKFQKMVCDALGLENAIILNGRAEAVAHHAQFRQTFDAVTARALAAMPVLPPIRPPKRALPPIQRAGLAGCSRQVGTPARVRWGISGRPRSLRRSPPTSPDRRSHRRGAAPPGGLRGAGPTAVPSSRRPE